MQKVMVWLLLGYDIYIREFKIPRYCITVNVDVFKH